MKALLQNAANNVSAQLRLLRRSLKQMRSKQYQILYIDGVYSEDAEFEVSLQNQLDVPMFRCLSSVKSIREQVNSQTQNERHGALSAIEVPPWARGFWGGVASSFPCPPHLMWGTHLPLGGKMEDTKKHEGAYLSVDSVPRIHGKIPLSLLPPFSPTFFFRLSSLPPPVSSALSNKQTFPISIYAIK